MWANDFGQSYKMPEMRHTRKKADRWAHGIGLIRMVRKQL